MDGQISPSNKPTASMKKLHALYHREEVACVNVSVSLCLCLCLSVFVDTSVFLLEPLKRSCHAQHPSVACIVSKEGKNRSGDEGAR